MAKYEGIILKVDAVMPTGHIYPKDVMEDGLKEFKERLEKGEVFGTFGDDPDRDYCVTDIHNATHKVDDVYIKSNGELWGKIETLPTPKGKLADDVICYSEFALRGLGTINEDHTVKDLHILSVDLVRATDPDKEVIEIVK